MNKFKVGMKVNVYQKPFVLEELEGVGVIKGTPEPMGDNDINGNPMYRSAVKFSREATRWYIRSFSTHA